MSKTKTDIIIVGGGMVGLSLACSLADSGLKITVIEAAAPSIFKEKFFDGRVSAIAYGSRKIFEANGAWYAMKPYAGPIWDIRVVDGESPMFLHYDHALVGKEPMGHIIENRYIRRALLEKIAEFKNINLIAPAKYTEIKYEEHSVTVHLENGEVLQGKLLVACDGKNSPIRESFGIKTIDSDYKQTGIVCTVKHEKNHRGVAVEKFLPAGPFAMLPMEDGHHSSLVWTEKSELAPLYMQMNDEDFAAEVRKRFGDWLGVIEVTGPRWNYPVSLTFAQSYIAQRMCLLGDAAHAIHPIAGQGFNLGLRDVAVLSELIKETASLGLDIGSQTMLQRYKKNRRIDNTQLIAVTDVLNRLFSNNIQPVKIARRIGLAAVNKLPRLKKLFIRHAMGTVQLDKKSGTKG